MKKIFLALWICSVSLLFGVDDLSQRQQTTKLSTGQGVQWDQPYSYIYGVHQMNVTGVGTPLINYIVGTISSPPIALLNTTGMINATTLPMISKHILLVSPNQYNAPLPSGENILIKNVNLFGTIQSAIDYAVNAVIPTVINRRWTILVEPGTYLENLSMQGPGASAIQTVNITLAALGLVTLGDGITTGNVTWKQADVVGLSGQRYPSLLMTVYRTSDTNYNARWIISNNFTFTRATAFTALMQLHYVTLQGTLTADPVRAYFCECVFEKPVTITPLSSSSYLYGAQGCLFKDVVKTYYYQNIVGCIFQNGMQCNNFNSGSYSETMAGILRSQLSGNFTMVSTNKYYIDKFTDAASPTAVIANKQVIQ